MMRQKKHAAIAFVLMGYSFNGLAQYKQFDTNRSIYISAKLTSDTKAELAHLTTFPVIKAFAQEEDASQATMRIPAKVVNGLVKWEFKSTTPIGFRESLTEKASTINFLAEPNDSVHFVDHNNKLFFEGYGAAKFNLTYELGRIDDSLKRTPEYKKLSFYFNDVFSLQDYFAWNEYLDKKAALVLPLIDSYKSKMSFFAYNYIKASTLQSIEYYRLRRFKHLMKPKEMDSVGGKLKNRYGLSEQDLVKIFDSTINNRNSGWLQYETPVVAGNLYLLTLLEIEAIRNNGFYNYRNNNDSLAKGKMADGSYMFYNMAKQKYKGIIREELLAYIFTNPLAGIKSIGFVPQMEKMLADYLSQPGYPEYKQFVKSYAESKGKASNGTGIAPAFRLIDKNDNPFYSEQLKGKVVIVNFWTSGNKQALQMGQGLRKVEKLYRNDTNVVFLNISIDSTKELWLKGIQKGYTSLGGINVYTGGEGRNHAIINHYDVLDFPYLAFIDPYGKIILPYPKPDPTKDDGKSLIALIQQQLQQMKDGPYLLDEGGKVISYYVNGTTLSKDQFDRNNVPALTVQTDQFDRPFKISPKVQLAVEPSQYARPQKLFALSDIEGEFAAFRMLLQANKIIDEDYNWIFGDGHLVFAGDMFDRGEQVTECLWFVYQLEEKARKAGGYVHFIMGNHEIMNLHGDHRYVQKKYSDNALLIGKPLKEIYNENSELGRWLRTKNVMEKIGDLLFVHGGVSEQINNASVDVEDINDLARLNYSTKKSDYGSENANLVMNSTYGPFWYRGYYSKDNGLATKNQVENSLQKFGVCHIVTGHTILADTISVHHNKRVINTDVKHRNGKSEALLIDGSVFYRVNAKGERFILFDDSVNN